MNNECTNALTITAIACKLFKCMDHDELLLLSVDLIQLADTIAAMLARKEICDAESD